MSRPAHTTPRTAVAAFDTYADAEHAVDVLSDRNFPVATVAIVGHGLHSFEQVTGRLTTAGAAWRGALSGAATGLVVSWFFSLLSWVVPLVALLSVLAMGVAIGAVLGLTFATITHLLQGGRRNFSSISAMVPDHYEVQVDETAADRARALLGDDLFTAAGGDRRARYSRPGINGLIADTERNRAEDGGQSP